MIGRQRCVTARLCPVCRCRPSEAPLSCPAVMGRAMLRSTGEKVRSASLLLHTSRTRRINTCFHKWWISWSRLRGGLRYKSVTLLPRIYRSDLIWQSGKIPWLNAGLVGNAHSPKFSRSFLFSLASRTEHQEQFHLDKHDLPHQFDLQTNSTRVDPWVIKFCSQPLTCKVSVQLNVWDPASPSTMWTCKKSSKWL